MFNLFNSSPSSDAAQKTVRWLIMGFFGYVLWQSYFSPPPVKPPGSPQPPQTADNVKDSDCNKSKFPLFSIPLIPTYILSVKTHDLKAGAGNPAVCGQNVNLHYEYMDQNGKVLDKGDKSAVIGGGVVLRAIELGLIGMKPGGERKVMIPPELMSAAHADASLAPAVKEKLAAAKITLIDASPAVPQSALPLRALDTAFGSGKQVTCGDKVNASISLWKVDGTQLFSSGDHPLAFTLGQSQVPYGIELGMSQMMEEGERTVIIPPGYNKPLSGDAASAESLPVTLPENEIVVARIALLHIGDYPAKNPPVSSPTPVSTPTPTQE